MSTFASQTSSGTVSSTSSSAHRFGLDEHDKSDILVYKMRSGYDISSQERLCKELDTSQDHQRWRCSRKPIPRGISRVEVKTRDLFTKREQQAYRNYPNQENAVASCAIPRNVFWRRLLFGEFKELFIVSPDSSAQSSPVERTESPHPI